MRMGLPLCLTVEGKTLFVCENSIVCNELPKNPLLVTSDEIQKTLAALCNNSIYLYENEIKQGFVSLSGGNRAGVCGFFNAEDMLVSVTSINIRIARQIFGCADSLLSCAKGGLLIVGPPGSGKTTILRDLIRSLSSGQDGTYHRVAVIDSRGEISGGGVLNLGVCTDVLHTAKKSIGIDIALRTMFPQFIAFDEIGTADELEGIKNCFNAGVGIITTAHGDNLSDIMHRDITRKFITSGAIHKVALLSSELGQLPQIIACEEIRDVYC
ncbi:MAG: hypothetical protein E7521_04395 [Ruminococcaceae bacterium]|nr:hypothetical protein [Oscillospiraceae bacterium]